MRLALPFSLAAYSILSLQPTPHNLLVVPVVSAAVPIQL